MSKQQPAPTGASPFDPAFPYRLSEAQQYALYEARHLCDVLHGLASNRDEFVELRTESVAVVAGLLTDLLDAAMPNLYRRPRHE